MKSSNSWLVLVKSYLAYRRGLGFDLETQELRLRDFARFAESRAIHEYLTVELAVAWARNSKVPSSATWSVRLETLRGFAKYLKRFDVKHEVPPRDIFGSHHRRSVPHIFTEDELLMLLDATEDLVPLNSLRAATCKTVFGLLASTGLRISEAVNLRRTDFNAGLNLLCIREGKFRKDRLVPVHPSVTEVLKEYEQLRDCMVANPMTNHFFLLDNGKQANQRSLIYALRIICRRLNLQPRGDHRNHRLHDLRHTFIVRSILRAYQRESDPCRTVMSLSTYVGHSSINYTYWYFTGTPELMAIAASRFSTYFQEGRK